MNIFSNEKTNVQQLPQSTLSAKSRTINIYEPNLTKTGESENSAYISDDNLDFQDSATQQSEVGNIKALLDRDIKNRSPPPLISINNNSTLRCINNSNESDCKVLKCYKNPYYLDEPFLQSPDSSSIGNELSFIFKPNNDLMEEIRTNRDPSSKTETFKLVQI